MPEAPITLMGSQVTPTCPVRPWTTTPKMPRRLETLGVSAAWTLWQHWRAPVLHWSEGASPRGTATAKEARARVVRAERVKNCMFA